MVDGPLEGRQATEGDAVSVAEFECCRRDDPPKWCLEVQEDIRGSIDWAAESDEREVYLFFEPSDGQLVGVVAFEGDGLDRFYINFLGVSADRWGHKYGYDVLRSVLRMIADRSPGAAVSWLVHPHNQHSVQLCREINAGEPVFPPDDQPYMEYTMVPE